MKTFNYFQPTDIRFGCGRVKEVGDMVARLGIRWRLYAKGEVRGRKRCYITFCDD